jgi:hypothetical protein
MTMTCISPRQFTQKFKIWKMHKYERRSGERKPRRTSSIYPHRYAILDNQRSLASTASDQHAAPDLPEAEAIDCRAVDSHQHKGPNHHDSIQLNPSSGNLGDAASSASTIDNSEDETSEDDATPPVMEQRHDPAAASSLRPEWNSLYGPDVPWLELDVETFRHLDGPKIMQVPRQETRIKLRRQKPVALAIWQVWHAGVLNEFEAYQACGFDMPAPPLVELDLKAWMRLYPCGRQPRSGIRLPYPNIPDVRKRSLTWEEYAQYGKFIALTKEPTTSETEEEYNDVAQMLATASLLAQEGRVALFGCFECILNCFESILEDQIHFLQLPCKRFEKQLSLGLSDLEEYCIKDHGILRRSAAILAMICYREIKSNQNTRFRYDLPPNLEDQLNIGGKFSLKRALVWAARLALYYASPELESSPLPTHLCARALSGCKKILETVSFHKSQDIHESTTRGCESSLSNMSQGLNFADFWTQWICDDNNFFLHEKVPSCN